MKRAVGCAVLSLLVGCGTAATGEDAGGFDSGGADADVTVCARSSDCGGTFCAPSRCEPGGVGADARGCVPLDPPCNTGETCEEASSSCVPAGCDEPDADGDGSEAVACGGDDCDDADANRYPGNTEICAPPDDHDEDCVPTTLGELDDDDDGFVTFECCNGETCGGDCDDARRDVHPDAVEQCNAIDDDCDGATDGPGAFCPVGACVEQRCRASSWLRAFGSPVYDEPRQVVTDGMGRVFVLISAGEPLTVGGDSLAAGRHLLAYEVDGRYQWSLSSVDGWMVLDDAEAALALIGPDDVRLVSTADASALRSWTHTAPAGWTGPVVFSTPHAESQRDSIVIATGVVPSGGGNTAALVQRLGWSGAVEDERLFDSTSTDYVLAMAVHPGGDVVIDIRTWSTIDVGTGVDQGPGHVIVYLDPLLETRWAITLPDIVNVYDLAVNDTDVMVVGGYSAAASLPWGDAWPHTGGEDAFGVMLERTDGAHRWTNLHNTSGRDTFELASFDSRGGLVTGGRFGGLIDVGIGLWAAEGPQDGFLLTWDVTDGVTLDGRRFSGPGIEAVQALAVDAFGASVVAGTFSGTATLAGFTTTSRGGYDGFITRISD